MNKEQDYASDTEESDEDFCPNEAGESAVSEEESDGCENELAEQAGEDEATEKPKKNVRRGKKLTKTAVKQKKVRKHDVNDSDEEDDEDKANDSLSGIQRRTTRQTEESLSNGKSKTQEKDELVSDDEDKSRTNALWADFLNDVGPSNKSNANDIKKSSASSSCNGKAQVTNADTSTKKTQNQAEIKSSSEESEKKKVTVTEVLDFAGEEVRIEKEVDASNVKENKAVATPTAKMQPFGRIMPGAGIKRPSSASTSSGGLGSILNKIGKKQKLSVLDKSQMDWKSFKKEEGIDETLQTYNKGKDGYLERQDFLQRTDLRQFEIEKNLRQTTRRPH